MLAGWLRRTQGAVSRIARSSEPCRDLDVLVHYAETLRIPEQLLWFRLPPPAAGAAFAASGVDGQDSDDPRSTTEEGEPVERRNLLKIASLGAAATVLGEDARTRLVETLEHEHAPDDTAVCLLEKRMAELYRAEETVPARQLVDAVARHRQEAAQLLNLSASAAASDQLRRRLLSTMGEADALSGWLFFDLGRDRPATIRLRSALNLARQAGDRPLFACTLTYFSYLAGKRGNHDSARRMLTDAQQHVRGPSYPATRSWIAAREAEESAYMGDVDAARLAVERAITAFDYAKPLDERPWTSFYSQSRLGSLALSAYTRIDHPEGEKLFEELLRSESPHNSKVRAIVQVDRAMASARRKDYQTASEYAEESLQLVRQTETSVARHRLSALRSALPAAGTAGNLRDRLAAAGI